MILGIENISDYQNIVRNKNIGLVTNFTGLTSKFNLTSEVLNQYGKVVKLFTPEHGLHGVAAAGENVDSYYDDKLKLDVISLYGDHQAPTESELSDVDIIVFDIQDIGIRYYTYIYTLLRVMQVAEKVNLSILVMDRPLPLGRENPLGDELTPDYFSFVGLLPLPNRYGLTIGELAEFIKDNYLPDLDLHVGHMINWNSRKDIKQNGLSWISPSPNLPTFDALRLYPGLCLIEGTNLSEGRGTVRPFEQVGAPWINGEFLAGYMNDDSKITQEGKLAFQPVWFEPLTSKFEGEVCQGIQIHIKDTEFNALKLGYSVLKSMIHLYTDKFTYDLVSPSIGTNHHFIEYLAGKNIRSEMDLNELIDDTEYDNKGFKKKVEKYFLY
ncbi:hypothetical protein CPR19092_LGOLGGFK_02485 [Companilactobacillus paralimentarius]|uniref:exo-beta-N-acetylmuramidase NamZ family protein n=1 Tax=Companilactobacillus paralimentarius TaxID=83526 RepID=UPI00384DB8A6